MTTSGSILAIRAPRLSNRQPAHSDGRAPRAEIGQGPRRRRSGACTVRARRVEGGRLLGSPERPSGPRAPRTPRALPTPPLPLTGGERERRAEPGQWPPHLAQHTLRPENAPLGSASGGQPFAGRQGPASTSASAPQRREGGGLVPARAAPTMAAHWKGNRTWGEAPLAGLRPLHGECEIPAAAREARPCSHARHDGTSGARLPAQCALGNERRFSLPSDSARLASARKLLPAMGTTNIGQWDETICDMIACQHPPCWQSMWRIESGRPRILLKKIVMPQRDSPEFEDKLPTLKIIDLPFNYPQRERVKCAERLGSISKTISSSKDARSYFSNSTLNDGWIPPISVLSSERNSFPGLNSRRESHSSHFSPISFTCLRQAEKIQVTNLTEFAVRRLGCQPSCGNTVVRWVPDTRPRFLQPEKPDLRAMAPPQKVCVKDLALESILSLKENQGMKRKISNKVPTGGQPYFLHLRQSQKSGNKPSSVGQEGNAGDGFLRTRRCSMSSLHLSLPNEGSASLKSKRGGALLENRETLAAPFTVQKAPGSVRSEAKIPAKGKDSRGSPGQPKIASGGSLVLRRLMAEHLHGAGSSQDKRGAGLLEHSQMPPESAAGNCKLQTPQGTVAKRKPCMKFVEYNTARLVMEGCNPFAPCLSKAECRYRQYCKHVASRKEAALARGEASEVGREPWPEGDGGSRAAQKTFARLRSPDPPPPPPSPLFESSNDSPLGCT
ncbi:uncharacterized protein C9orf43 homolog [Candoia aspera]|uniref:uncharacterized protein C9orf43 homolog n=1 Tax=Candoia aspera TaxID=51853 RepID=UPI002FD7A2B4